MDAAEEDSEGPPPLEDTDDWQFEDISFPVDCGEYTFDETPDDTVLGFGDDEDKWFVESSDGAYLIAVTAQWPLLN
jgi:hypothetical protein